MRPRPGRSGAPFYLILNKKKWDGLTAADKKAIEPLMGEYFARLAGAGWNKMNDTGRAAGIKQGTKIMAAPAPVVAAVRKINADLETRYVTAMAKDGIDGAALIKFFRPEAAKLGAK